MKTTNERLVRIFVNKEDIEKGKIGRSDSCPIANAVKRTLGVKNAFALPHSISIVVGNIILRSKVSRDTKNYLNTYDAGKGMKPFSFMLALKSE